MFAAFSITFENVGSSLIGRKLPGSRSPFLWIGEIFASFSFFGKFPVSKHLLIIRVSGGARFDAHSLTSFGGISSKPDDVFDDKVLMIFHVCALSIALSWNLLIYDSFKLKVLKVVESKNGHHAGMGATFCIEPEKRQSTFLGPLEWRNLFRPSNKVSSYEKLT